MKEKRSGNLTSGSAHPDTQTVLNAVTGHPLGHTLSPQLHARIYELLGFNAVMLAFPHEDIAAVIASMRTLPIHLLAVTLPHKQEVMKHLDHIDATAREIGAVNTVINRGGKLHGYNTDVVGIAEALKGVPLKNSNVLVLGAGGAARPLCWFLKKNDAHIFCLNRTRTKAEELMKEFGGTALDNESLGQLHKAGKTALDIVINATPVGMEPHTNESPLDKNLLRKDQAVFDFIYNPSETRLLREAKKAGCKTINGMPMLVAQAVEQVRLWSGKELTASQKEGLQNAMESP